MAFDPNRPLNKDGTPATITMLKDNTENRPAKEISSYAGATQYKGE